MSRRNIVIVVIAVLVVLLLVWFTVPNREEEAAVALEDAVKIEQAGQFGQAIDAYRKVVDDFAGTEAAKKAAVNLERVKTDATRVATLEARKVLERLALVMNGYKEMLGMAPTSLEQLDSGEYMFDSDYMAEIPPEGYTCYVLFEPAYATYQLFSFRASDSTAVRFSADGQAEPIGKDALDQEIGKPGLHKVEKGRVVFLQPAS